MSLRPASAGRTALDRQSEPSLRSKGLRRTVAAISSSLLVLSLAGVSMAGSALADEQEERQTISRDELETARDAALAAATDVAEIRAQLAVAQSEVDYAHVDAAIAAEKYNGVLYQLELARTAATTARAAVSDAKRGVDEQQASYSQALVRSYQSSEHVSGVASLVAAGEVSDFVERRVTMDNAVDALEGRYKQFRASAVVADLAADNATAAEDEATSLEVEARALRDAATAAAASATARAAALEETRDLAIERLAELEGISVGLARQRQEQLEAEAAERAAEARQAEAERKAAAEARAEEERRAEERAAERRAAARAERARRQQERAQREARDEGERQDEADREVEETANRPVPVPPATRPGTTPAPSRGAAAAIAFAEAQLGEPYVWGAAGPDSWDCSGLTSKAWAAGGKTLPHWSVAQYQQSTPISASQLRPGDLLFWSDNSSSSSIFHVALYVGDGMMIHAPRTGRPVTKESINYWRPADFHARP